MTVSLVQHAEVVNSAVANALRCTPPQEENRVLSSWIRCVRDYGIDPGRPQPVEVVDNGQLRTLQGAMAELLDTAKPEMSNLNHQLAGSGFAILLTDPNGVVLHALGDPEFIRVSARNGIVPGAVWTEKARGTNGMGTCLFERRPLVIHREEHLLGCNVELTCSAAPVFDPHGRLLGVLDASARAHLAQQHTLALVNMSAQTIENRILLHQYRNAHIIRFHSRPEFVSTLGEGELAITEDGRICAANRNALFHLNVSSHSALEGRNISSIFELTLGNLVDSIAPAGAKPVPIYEATRGNRFFAIVQKPEQSAIVYPSRPRPKPTVDFLHDTTRVVLRDLALGDPAMERNISRAGKVAGSDVPILITGETGTGKELFARAIHNSVGSGKPFVAINCASLPEPLIESELFGYAFGAFTGARRDGRRGKILQANGGTLFLDEIGDMPLGLQSRLLRVLEDRELTPLGSETPAKVQFRLISATHRKLPDLISCGEFREDLYYRLQGIEIHLPALRERTDRKALIQNLLMGDLGRDQALRVDESVIALLMKQPWPGNVRQLRNTLRAAIALSDEGRITIAELPDELRRSEIPSAPGTGNDSAPERPDLNCIQSAERAALLDGLSRHLWNISTLARELHTSRNTLYRKIKRYNINHRIADMHP